VITDLRKPRYLVHYCRGGCCLKKIVDRVKKARLLGSYWGGFLGLATLDELREAGIFVNALPLKSKTHD
jgi:hypothetical protein